MKQYVSRKDRIERQVVRSIYRDKETKFSFATYVVVADRHVALAQQIRAMK